MNSQIALITGAGQRIGAGIARRLHSEGFNLALHYRNSIEPAKQLADELNSRRPDSVSLFFANFKGKADAEELAKKVLEKYSKIDLLVNNASTFTPANWGAIGEKEWSDTINDNIGFALFLTQALSEALKKNRGSVVNISDHLPVSTLRNYPIYAMGKSALNTLTKIITLILAPEVRANTIALGAVLRPKSEKNQNAQYPQTKIAKIPLGRTGEVEEVGQTVVFLARSASYITGQTFFLDGGRRLIAT